MEVNLDEVLLNYTINKTAVQASGSSVICQLLHSHQYDPLVEILGADLHLDAEQPLPDQLSTAAARDPVRLQLLGVALLQQFVRANWTAGGTSARPAHLFPRLAQPAIEAILVDDTGGESLVPLAQDLAALAAAKLILVDNRTNNTSCPLLSVLWALRCSGALQDVLEEKADQLHASMAALAAEGRAAADASCSSRQLLLSALFHLEIARFHGAYHEVREMMLATEAAGRCVGLSVKDTGALGKRTKHQVKDLAQFTLDIEIADRNQTEIDTENEEHSISPELLTADLKLDDEIRLDRIEFSDGGRDRLLHLSAVQQCVLMARFCLKRRAVPIADELSMEELLPHLTPILAHPVCWSLHTAALLYRSQLESQHSRSVERARAQLEAVLESLQTGTASETGPRMLHIHSSRLPPWWEVERLLASILVSLGATKAALERFLRLQRWDEVIACYNLLQMRHKAAEVIRERMEKSGETPRLWCQMGDATDDLECYHRALAISRNHKNARAFKSLGLHYYFGKEYAKAVTYFQESLAVSRFQLDVWLRLGFSAMELEDWSEGARAYRAYTTLETDNFEAWNNLAKCYIRLGQKERAWRVLHEALRCDYDNWKVWDNLMAIATDLAVFEDSLRAYNRILDLKQVHVDVEVLAILVRVVTEKLLDNSGSSCEKYREGLAKLLARLTVCMPREPEPWYQYARLLLADEPSIEDRVKGCQYLQKSLAAHTSQRGWEKEEAVCQTVLRRGAELSRAILSVPDPPSQLQLANSARLALTGALRLVQQAQTSIATGSLGPQLAAEHEEGQQLLNALLNRVNELKAVSA